MRGSYAGAIGIPQFMPSSTRRYAVDFDGNGAVDLRQQPGRRDRQRRQLPEGARLAARRRGAAGGARGRRRLAGARRRLGRSQARARRTCGRRAWSSTDCPRACARVLVELETPDKPSDYRIGLHNFWVLTRYNRSAFYASAVHDLAQALKKGYLGR